MNSDYMPCNLCLPETLSPENVISPLISWLVIPPDRGPGIGSLSSSIPHPPPHDQTLPWPSAARQINLYWLTCDKCDIWWNVCFRWWWTDIDPEEWGTRLCNYWLSQGPNIPHAFQHIQFWPEFFRISIVTIFTCNKFNLFMKYKKMVTEMNYV